MVCSGCGREVTLMGNGKCGFCQPPDPPIEPIERWCADVGLDPRTAAPKIQKTIREKAAELGGDV